MTGQESPPIHCGYCDAPLHRVNGQMVDLRNAAHGGTYDHCPVNPTHEHKAVR